MSENQFFFLAALKHGRYRSVLCTAWCNMLFSAVVLILWNYFQRLTMSVRPHWSTVTSTTSSPSLCISLVVYQANPFVYIIKVLPGLVPLRLPFGNVMWSPALLWQWCQPWSYLCVCVTSVYIVLCCLCAWRRKLSLTYSLLSVTENLNFSPVYAWECYDCLLLRLKSMWQAWASLEVWLYLQGSSTLPFCPIFFSSTLCLAILTSLLSWLCAFSDLAPSQCKLAQIVENQSSGTGKTLFFFFFPSVLDVGYCLCCRGRIVGVRKMIFRMYVYVHTQVSFLITANIKWAHLHHVTPTLGTDSDI